MKKKLMLCFIVLLAGCWYVTLKSLAGGDSGYSKAIAQAKRLEEKEIYIK